jgi:hypothetical protein
VPHEENWITFQRDGASGPRLILVDAGLDEANLVPDPSRTYAAAVRFDLKDPEPKGFGGEKECYAIEDAVEELVPIAAEECSAVLAGRVRGGGRMDFFFYMPESKSAAFGGVVRRMLASLGATMRGRADAEWKTYRQLQPNKAELRMFHNAQLIGVMQADGDRIQVPRPVTHYIYFPMDRAASAQEYASALTKDDFEVEVRKDEQEGHVEVIAHRQDSIELLQITRLNNKLDALAAEFGGDYDGWETVPVKGKKPFWKR